MSKLKLYLSRPINGRQPEEVNEYFTSTKRKYELLGYQVLSPILSETEVRTAWEHRENGDGRPTLTNSALYNKDRWMVLNSDIILIDLLDVNDAIAVGCVCELIWAKEHNKHTVVVMEKGNVHRHAFILEATDVLFESREEAKNYLERLMKSAT